MQERSVVERVEILERKVEILERLPERVTAVELQIVQLRDEMRGEFSALREEIRAGDEETRRQLREGDEETRRFSAYSTRMSSRVFRCCRSTCLALARRERARA
jgi:predicted phage gp36 major capsid-like protein